MPTLKEIEYQMAIFLAAHSGESATSINSTFGNVFTATQLAALNHYITTYQSVIQCVGNAFSDFTNGSGGWGGPGRCPLKTAAAAEIYHKI